MLEDAFLRCLENSKCKNFPEVLTMMAPTGPTNNKYLTLSLMGRGADLGKRHAILLFL